ILTESPYFLMVAAREDTRILTESPYFLMVAAREDTRILTESPYFLMVAAREDTRILTESPYFLLVAGTFSLSSAVPFVDFLSYLTTHCASSPRISNNSIPFFVNSYSTRGGVSGYTLRSTIFL